MKTLICATAIWLVYSFAGVSSVQSQTQAVEGYTVLRGVSGASICLGRWVPSRDVALPGVCEGQTVDTDQLTAVSAKLSADRLDQLLLVIAAIDQKMSVNNDQIKRLIDATVKTQTSIDQQVKQVSELLHETISRRFDALPEEILSNDLFREEITKLKEDILKEIENRYPARPAPSTK